MNAELTTSFEEAQFNAFLKYRSFGYEELMAAIGGYLGLFVGVSAISLFELVYFVYSLFRTDRSEIALAQDQKNYVAKVLQSFGNSSTVHGINHVVSNKPKVEKILWLVVLAVMSIHCFRTILVSYRHKEDNPILFQIDEEMMSYKDVRVVISK